MPFILNQTHEPLGHCSYQNWNDVYKELHFKHVTKHLLWEEYAQQYPNRSYSYSRYCHLYGEWQKKQKRSMRQPHKAGEKLFVDYAGQTVPVVQASTGEVRFAQIFVAVLGASNYTFAEATWTQRSSHVRAFTFIGGVPRLVVPDNLKSGVTEACRYDPDLNSSYEQQGAHCTVRPSCQLGPESLRTKLRLQIIERWILARLRHHTFTRKRFGA